MSKLVKKTEEQIISAVSDAIKANIADGSFIEAEIPAFKTEIPADRKNGCWKKVLPQWNPRSAW